MSLGVQLVWLVTLGIHGRLRLGIKSSRTEIRVLEEQLGESKAPAVPR